MARHIEAESAAFIDVARRLVQYRNGLAVQQKAQRIGGQPLPRRLAIGVVLERKQALDAFDPLRGNAERQGQSRRPRER